MFTKVLSDYELARLREPRTEEDQEILNNLPEQTRKLIRDSKGNTVLMPLDSDHINAVYKSKTTSHSQCQWAIQFLKI